MSFREPSEIRAADKTIVRSESCSNLARSLATPSDEVALTLGPSPRKCPAKGPGWIDPTLSAIYVVRAKDIGLCKIGYTKNLRMRMTTLNVDSPVPLELAHFVYVVGHPIAKIVEAEAQLSLVDRCVRGEWFSIAVEEGAAAIFTAIEARGFKWWSERDRREMGHRAFRTHMKDWQRYAA